MILRSTIQKIFWVILDKTRILKILKRQNIFESIEIFGRENKTKNILKTIRVWGKLYGLVGILAPLIVLIPWAGAQSLRHRASSSSLEEEKGRKYLEYFIIITPERNALIGEYQIKPLQSRSYNLYVVAEMILILLSALCPGFHLNFSSSSRLRLPSEQVTPLLRTLSQLSATVSGTSQDLTLLSQDLKMIKEGRMRDKYISILRQI